MDNSSWLLFPGSPFLPESEHSLTNVIRLINKRHIAPGLAIALELADLAIIVHELHEKDMDFLAYQYQADAINLSHFMFGYTTPVSLIMGAYFSRVKTLKEVIKILNPPSEDPLLQELSAYKAFHLIRSIEIFQTLENRHPAIASSQIYDIVRQKPFVLDQFFLIGLEASEYYYRKLLDSIEPV